METRRCFTRFPSGFHWGCHCESPMETCWGDRLVRLPSSFRWVSTGFHRVATAKNVGNWCHPVSILGAPNFHQFRRDAAAKRGGKRFPPRFHWFPTGCAPSFHQVFYVFPSVKFRCFCRFAVVASFLASMRFKYGYQLAGLINSCLYNRIHGTGSRRF